MNFGCSWWTSARFGGTQARCGRSRPEQYLSERGPNLGIRFKLSVHRHMRSAEKNKCNMVLSSQAGTPKTEASRSHQLSTQADALRAAPVFGPCHALHAPPRSSWPPTALSARRPLPRPKRVGSAPPIPRLRPACRGTPVHWDLGAQLWHGRPRGSTTSTDRANVPISPKSLTEGVLL